MVQATSVTYLGERSLGDVDFALSFPSASSATSNVSWMALFGIAVVSSMGYGRTLDASRCSGSDDNIKISEKLTGTCHFSVMR